MKDAPRQHGFPDLTAMVDIPPTNAHPLTHKTSQRGMGRGPATRAGSPEVAPLVDRFAKGKEAPVLSVVSTQQHLGSGNIFTGLSSRHGASCFFVAPWVVLVFGSSTML